MGVLDGILGRNVNLGDVVKRATEGMQVTDGYKKRVEQCKADPGIPLTKWSTNEAIRDLPVNELSPEFAKQIHDEQIERLRLKGCDRAEKTVDKSVSSGNPLDYFIKAHDQLKDARKQTGGLR